MFVEGNTADYTSLYDECGAFLKTMEMAEIEEAVQNGKAEMKRRRDDHFFLRITKK